MGKYDSSRTRVVPVFDALMERDSSGNSWLPRLLQLGSLSSGRLEGLVPGPLVAEQRKWWGRNERHLNPPRDLLRWLVENLDEPASQSCWGSGDTKTKRKLLVAGHKEAKEEALRLLESEPKRSAWYVLEGQSRPDACLETANLVLIIEGKRTEAKPTTTTTWMPQRSQMLRHMDAAWEVRKEKKVLGMMIVEGSAETGSLEPDSYWSRQAEDQIKEEMLTKSLPHRTPKERAQIAEGFLEATTWQRVCSELRLPWPPATDID